MRRTGWALVLGLVAAAPAGANVGSVMMVAKFAHLTMLNLVIAAVECWVILWLWRRRERSWVYVWLLGANLASAAAGLILLPWLLSPLTLALLGEPPQLRWRLALYALWTACFVVSVAIEWPFVHSSLRRPSRTESLRVCLLANTATYALLVAFYNSASEHTLFTDVEIVPSEVIECDERARIAVIDDQGVVSTLRLDGSDRKVLASTVMNGRGARLYLRLNTSADPPTYDLRAYRSMAHERRLFLASKDWDLLVAEALAPELPSDPDGRDLTTYPRPVDWEWSIRLDRPATQVRVSGHWRGGLWARLGREEVHWRHEDPVAVIGAVDATVMPDGLIVFQLARGGIRPMATYRPIFVLDLANRQVAEVARGESFVAYLTGPHQGAVQ